MHSDAEGEPVGVCGLVSWDHAERNIRRWGCSGSRMVYDLLLGQQQEAVRAVEEIEMVGLVKIAEVRDIELSEIEGAIYFRTRCADEYPDDVRNEVDVRQLQEVALPYVQGLADDDPLLVRYAAAFEVYRDIEDELLVSSWKWDRFGFGPSTTAAEWLERRVQEMETFVRGAADAAKDSIVFAVHEGQHRQYSLRAVLVAMWRAEVDGEVVGLFDTSDEALSEAKEIAKLMDGAEALVE